VTNSGADVVINSSGLTVTNGAITVTNGSSVVVIDGTSNMFKISATGTQSVAAAANTIAALRTTTLTGLGTLSTTPAHTSFLAIGNLATSAQFLGALMTGVFWSFSATASGGANAAAGLTVSGQLAASYTTLNGSNQCVVNMYYSTFGALSFYHRYYVMKEAAL